MKYVWDTNIAIAAMNGVPQVDERMDALHRADMGIPLVALGELLYGAHRSRWRDDNLASIRRLRRRIVTLQVSESIVERYARLRAGRGVTLSDFDLVIASTAVEHDAVLVTDDRGLLQAPINALRAENWLEG